MLLPKTLETLASIKSEVVQETITDMLQTDGVNVSAIDVIFGSSFLYVEMAEGVLVNVFLYEGRISYKQSKNEGLPKLHFCHCSVIKQDFSAQSRQNTLKNRHYLASKPQKNAFSFSIKQGLSEVGMYNDYPLELCKACEEMLKNRCKIKGKIEDFIFNHSLLSLLESHKELRKMELNILQSNGIKCYKCKKPISQEAQMWLQIQNNIIKIYCC